MKRHIATLLTTILVGSASVFAQSINDAASNYNRFVQQLSAGSELSAFQSLYQSYEGYMQVLNSSSQSAYHAQARSALKEIFPYLQRGAYFYSERNNQAKTLQFAQAYVGLAINPSMQGENLRTDSNYPILAKLAAFNTWNNREHAKAIPFLQAYLNTGDTDRREDAYSCIGKAYYEMKDYSNAKRYLSEGLQQYPRSLSMLSTMINTCVENKDDYALQPYLVQALAIRPNDEGLLRNQGLLYERQQQFEQAVAIYERLRTLRPQSLDVARHLALDYHNAGIQYMQSARMEPNSKRSSQLKQQGEKYLRLAEPVLSQIMASDPLSVKFAVAQANVYSLLSENAKLANINARLTSLGIARVESSKDIAMIGYDDPSPVPTPRNNVNNQPVPQPVPTPTPEPAPPSLADVDQNIPVNPANNDRTFAVVIANENYDHIAKVPYANNDGKRFAEYCHKVLGLPDENIRTHYDVTSLGLRGAVKDIQKIAKALHGNLNVIFYYAGHGIPDEKTKDAYLLPKDTYGLDTEGCLALNDLYNQLGSLKAQNVCVFLDACFSGGTRDGGSVNPTQRGVAIRPNPEEARGNMVVFTAATGNETAMPYSEKQHGLFTYYLLKKMQTTRGNVTLKELKDYLEEQVPLRAQLTNKKEQTPTTMVSPQFGNRWEILKLTR